MTKENTDNQNRIDEGILYEQSLHHINNDLNRFHQSKTAEPGRYYISRQNGRSYEAETVTDPETVSTGDEILVISPTIDHVSSQFIESVNGNTLHVRTANNDFTYKLTKDGWKITEIGYDNKPTESTSISITILCVLSKECI